MHALSSIRFKGVYNMGRSELTSEGRSENRKGTLDIFFYLNPKSQKLDTFAVTGTELEAFRRDRTNWEDRRDQLDTQFEEAVDTISVNKPDGEVSWEEVDQYWQERQWGTFREADRQLADERYQMEETYAQKASPDVPKDIQTLFARFEEPSKTLMQQVAETLNRMKNAVYKK